VSARSGAAPRILILTTSIGEGHDLPARVLADAVRREAPGASVTVVDGLAVMGRLVTFVVRDGSEVLLRRLTAIFDVQYWLITNIAPVRWLLRTLGYALGGTRLLRLVQSHDPDVVVSTYPGTTEVLGMLRRRGRLATPVCSAITDLAALRYWAHPGVDLHLVTHPESIDEVRRVARREEIHCVRGLTSPEFETERDRAEARRSLDLPAERPIVLVSGGGWGIGDLEGAIRVALRIDEAFVVCLCGRADAVRERLSRAYADEPRVRVLGFTDRMSDLLAAADVLVHATAGLTVLEALMRGCPTISYGWGIAHIRANNRAFARFGLAEVATSPGELHDALVRSLARPREPDRSFAQLPSASSLVLAAAAAD
jgi:UDP-N-acetylglucosamine:LPS N-acetylglucosamine transferase